MLGSYKRSSYKHSSGAVLTAKEHQRRYNAFLKRLRQARLDAGLRQEDVRRKIGIYQTYLSKIESGERRLDIVELEELARIYKKPMTFFLP
jgi:ribosome-binding protein aMBF1 (putative translation factor)